MKKVIDSDVFMSKLKAKNSKDTDNKVNKEFNVRSNFIDLYMQGEELSFEEEIIMNSITDSEGNIDLRKVIALQQRIIESSNAIGNRYRRLSIIYLICLSISVTIDIFRWLL